MTYTWTQFKITEALAGALVGFQQEAAYDLSKTGKVEYKHRPGPGQYEIVIDGITMAIDMTGTVISTIPASAYVGQRLMAVKAEMGDEGAVGSSITRTRGSSGEGRDATAVLSTMEPRDHFAINALNAMLVHMNKPETKDDATMLMISRAAYRWAQAMMIAAADSREGQSTTPSTSVDVKSGDLQSNTEKLLYNISKVMQDGLVIKTDDALAVQSEDGIDIPTVAGGISIEVSVFKNKFIRFKATPMVYSNISIYLALTTDDGNREAGFVMTRGSVVSLMPLDEAVTSITAITAKQLRGQGGNDPNEYTLV